MQNIAPRASRLIKLNLGDTMWMAHFKYKYYI